MNVDSGGVSFALTDEQLELQAIARVFAAEEVRPVARELDRVVDPSKAFPTDLIRRASELGLRTLSLPREFGGRAAGAVTQAIVLEELCCGDVGFGMAILHAWREGLALAVHTTAEQRQRFLPDFLADPSYLTSLAMSEPHAGSDHVLPYAGTLEAGVRTTAVKDGDEFVINGHKKWMSNGAIARMVILLARTDTTVPWNRGSSLFLVPADTPGFGNGVIEDKLGIRLNQNAELIFDNCRVPASNLLGDFNGGPAALAKMSRGSLFKEGIKSIAVARAAYDEALAWSKSRVQGGAPIIEHQPVAAELADMATKIAAARALAWQAAWAIDVDSPQAATLEPMAKVFAGQMAVEVAVSALELHGGYGVLRDNHVEKLVRDAVSMLHAFGGNHAIRARLAGALTAADPQDS